MTGKIFIYGVPGVGKTYFSKVLGKHLNMPTIEMDRLKRKVRKGKSKNKSPFLYLGTCKAYQKFGDLSDKNTVKGLLAVRLALKKAVADEVKKHRSAVFEGAFLDPHLLTQLGKPILLIASDEKRHRKQFLHHIDRLLDLKGNEFKSARLVQEYLIKEAEKLNIQIVDNQTSVENYTF